MNAEVQTFPVDPKNAARSEPSTHIILRPTSFAEVGMLRWAFQTGQVRAMLSEVALIDTEYHFIIRLLTDKAYQEREKYGMNTPRG